MLERPSARFENDGYARTGQNKTRRLTRQTEKKRGTAIVSAVPWFKDWMLTNKTSVGRRERGYLSMQGRDVLMLKRETSGRQREQRCQDGGENRPRCWSCERNQISSRDRVFEEVHGYLHRSDSMKASALAYRNCTFPPEEHRPIQGCGFFRPH